jgi:hypothetical protein
VGTETDQRKSDFQPIPNLGGLIEKKLSSRDANFTLPLIGALKVGLVGRGCKNGGSILHPLIIKKHSNSLETSLIAEP